MFPWCAAQIWIKTSVKLSQKDQSFVISAAWQAAKLSTKWYGRKAHCLVHISVGQMTDNSQQNST